MSAFLLPQNCQDVFCEHEEMRMQKLRRVSLMVAPINMNCSSRKTKNVAPSFKNILPSPSMYIYMYTIPFYAGNCSTKLERIGVRCCNQRKRNFQLYLPILCRFNCNTSHYTKPNSWTSLPGECKSRNSGQIDRQINSHAIPLGQQSTLEIS